MSDPFPGKLREYCLRGPEHLSRPAPHVWAANVEVMPTDRRYEMGKRIPLDPHPLGQREGWTDTRPIVLGPVLGE